MGAATGPRGVAHSLVFLQAVQLVSAQAPEPPLPRGAAPPRAAGDGAEGRQDGREPAAPPPLSALHLATSTPGAEPRPPSLAARRAAGFPLHPQIPVGRAAPVLPPLLPRVGGAPGDGGRSGLQPSPPVRHGRQTPARSARKAPVPRRGRVPVQGGRPRCLLSPAASCSPAWEGFSYLGGRSGHRVTRTKGCQGLSWPRYVQPRGCWEG